MWRDVPSQLIPFRLVDTSGAFVAGASPTGQISVDGGVPSAVTIVEQGGGGYHATPSQAQTAGRVINLLVTDAGAVDTGLTIYPRDVGEAYPDGIHVDTVNGTAGQTIGLNGTRSNPSSNLANALALTAATGIRCLNVHGAIAPAAGESLAGHVILGADADAKVSITAVYPTGNGTLFRDLTIEGLTTTPIGEITAERCRVTATPAFQASTLIDCAFLNGTTLLDAGGGEFDLIRPTWTEQSILQITNALRVDIQGSRGFLTLTNIGTGDNVYADHVGQVELGLANDGGTLTLVGMGSLEGSLGGGTTIDATRYLRVAQSVIELQAVALLDLVNGVETGLTVRQALRGLAAVNFGNRAGLPAGPATSAAAVAGAPADRVTRTFDANGNLTVATNL